MKSWTDSANTTVGQRVTVEASMACLGDCQVRLVSTNPECTVTHFISDQNTSTNVDNNDSIGSIEVVKVVDSLETCFVRISLIATINDLTTVSYSVVSGEADILRANLALD